jgi:hypothetical protein
MAHIKSLAVPATISLFNVSPQPVWLMTSTSTWTAISTCPSKISETLPSCFSALRVSDVCGPFVTQCIDFSLPTGCHIRMHAPELWNRHFSHAAGKSRQAIVTGEEHWSTTYLQCQGLAQCYLTEWFNWISNESLECLTSMFLTHLQLPSKSTSARHVYITLQNSWWERRQHIQKRQFYLMGLACMWYTQFQLQVLKWKKINGQNGLLTSSVR